MIPFARAAPLGRDVTVVAELGCGLVALAKPAGLLSHPNQPGEEGRALLRCAYARQGEFYQWPTEGAPGARAWLLNRLDSGTSGVLLLARSAELAQHIRTHFKQRRVQKVYAALVFGRPAKDQEIWHDRLTVQKSGGRVRTSTGGRVVAEAAHHRIESVETPVGSLSLIQLEPKTGRSHQLRVQCAHHGLPIVGDATYGDFRRNREFVKRGGSKRLFLHSFRTAFDFTWQDQTWRLVAEAPLPREFTAALTS